MTQIFICSPKKIFKNKLILNEYVLKVVNGRRNYIKYSNICATFEAILEAFPSLHIVKYGCMNIEPDDLRLKLPKTCYLIFFILLVHTKPILSIKTFIQKVKVNFL